MLVKQKIQRIIGLHRERVAQLFELYGIDLPITVQNVFDAIYVNGKDFAENFWALDTLNFSGNAKEKIKSFFNKPVEIEDNRPVIVIAVAVIVVLVILVILTRKKNAE